MSAIEENRSDVIEVPQYRADIDGLRAIAVAAVVLFHAKVPGFKGGFIGVDVFFVISGFLIGNLIYRSTKANNFSFAQFYARRAQRILPALLAVMIFIVIVGLFLLSPQELVAVANSVFSTAFAVSNIRFLRSIGYFKPAAALDPVLMTWSLGVEEQFYLIFPLILVTTQRLCAKATFLILLLITILSFVWCVWLTQLRPSAAFYLLPSRAWELGVGASLAIFKASSSRAISGSLSQALSVAAFVLLFGSILFLNDQRGWPGYWALPPVLATAALIATPAGIINRLILSSRPFVALGLISYSWYLWHWPLMAFIRVSSIGEPRPAAMAATILLGLGLGALSWRFIEQPFRRLRQSGRWLLVSYGTAVAATAALSLAVAQLHGFPARLPVADRAIEADVSATHNYECLRTPTDLPQTSGMCVRSVADRPSIAIVGDSHAAALAPALQELAARAGYGSAVFAMQSCRPLLGVAIDKRKEPKFRLLCASYMKATFSWIVSQPNIKIVLLAGHWFTLSDDGGRLVSSDDPGESSPRELLRQGVASATRFVSKAGKAAFVIQDVPHWTFEPPAVATANLIPARRWLQELASPPHDLRDGTAIPAIDMDEVERSVLAGAKQGGAQYIVVRPSLCRGDRCKYADDTGLLYADHSHLTYRGAMTVLSYAWPTIRPAFSLLARTKFGQVRFGAAADHFPHPPSQMLMVSQTP